MISHPGGRAGYTSRLLRISWQFGYRSTLSFQVWQWLRGTRLQVQQVRFASYRALPGSV